eukprot:SAG31_NODE_30012_length_386_cov_1.240418_1_plen_114_part_10
MEDTTDSIVVQARKLREEIHIRGACAVSVGIPSCEATCRAPHHVVRYHILRCNTIADDSLRSRGANNSTGNFGIQDQRAALLWVHQNVVAFGGNASQVRPKTNRRMQLRFTGRA